MEEAYRTTTYPPKPSGLCSSYCPVTSCPYHGKGVALMLVYCECPDCGFDAVLHSRPEPYYCFLCAGDSGHDVVMRQRPVDEAPDKVEGRDMRQ